MANTVPLCPHCKRGTRIEDINPERRIDTSYCGFCGKNWPLTSQQIRQAGDMARDPTPLKEPA